MATTVEVRTRDDGRFPNSSLPALVHRGALDAPSADAVEQRFAAHGWTGGWRSGVFGFHHYHSTAHEVLGVFRGSALLQLGGPAGEQVEVAVGDVVVIPAGVAHCCLRDDGLQVVGAYDRGRTWDLLRGEPGERPAADERIAEVPLPGRDPVLGPEGGTATLWSTP